MEKTSALNSGKLTTVNSRGVCRHWAKGYCARGEKCKFAHAKTKAEKPCHQFLMKRICSYGMNCKFAHDGPTAGNEGAVIASSTVGDIERHKETRLKSTSVNITDSVTNCHSPSPCRNWAKGSCFRGDQCQFTHAKTTARNQCNEFLMKGFCSYGDNCKFAHKGPNSENASGDAASSEIQNFVQRLERQLKSNRVEFDDDRSLWHSSWSLAARDSKLSSILVRAWLALPASSSLAPTTSNQLLALKKLSEGSMNLKVATAIVDVLEKRIACGITRYDGTISVADMCAQVEALKSSTCESILHLMRDHRNVSRGAPLLVRIHGASERCARALRDAEHRSPEDVESVPKVQHWRGWRQPTLGWLQEGTWLDAPQLLSAYESLDDYCRTLERMLTLLSFYHAAGSIFPRCRKLSEQNGERMQCRQPLLAVVGDEKRQCGHKLPDQSTCRRPAKFSCSRRGHEAICKSCLRRLQKGQNGLTGLPSRYASTDIYDAEVERETMRRGSQIIILKSLASRNPPKEKPNWSTSYRLNCSALVAIAKLGYSGEPLDSDRRLAWAEIVPVDAKRGIKGDYRFRMEARVAIRLLTTSDIPSLARSFDDDIFDLGTQVALLDCRVFVPEVIGVLSTISDPEFLKHLGSIPFSQQLIAGQEKKPPPTPPEDGDEGKSVTHVIEKALKSSDMRLLHRLPAETMNQLVRRISKLASDSKLYGAQLEAFAAALSKPLHMIQGPPGTGKSYVGVQLVLALNIIREHVEKTGAAVGPIVLLSYKNHALDEMLVDIVKSNHLGSASRSFACSTGNSCPYGKGSLIRCGNPEHPMLENYKERSSQVEFWANNTLSARQACIRDAKALSRHWRQLAQEFSDAAKDDDVTHSLRVLDAWSQQCHRLAKTDVLGSVLLGVLLRSKVDPNEALDSGESAESAYALLETLCGGRVTIPKISAGIVDFPMLTQGNEHWLTPDGYSRVHFLLDKWLRGEKPPPRCKANEEDGCFMPVSDAGTYCSQFHNCQHHSSCAKRRASVVCKDTHRATVCCDEHRCSAIGGECVEPRIECSALCKNHSCSQLPASQEHCLLCHEVYAGRAESHFGIYSFIPLEGFDFCVEHKCAVPNCNSFRAHSSTSPSSEKYCARHACRRCPPGARSVVDLGDNLSHVCEQHRCAYADISSKSRCGREVQDESLFCDHHTCIVCREQGLSSHWQSCCAIEVPPRNVCAGHTLCTYQDPNHGSAPCAKLARGDRNLCEQHYALSEQNTQKLWGVANAQQCMGKSKRGERCKARVSSPVSTAIVYCHDHASQEPSSEVDRESDLDSKDDSKDGISVAEFEFLLVRKDTNDAIDDSLNGSLDDWYHDGVEESKEESADIERPRSDNMRGIAGETNKASQGNESRIQGQVENEDVHQEVSNTAYTHEEIERSFKISSGSSRGVLFRDVEIADACEQPVFDAPRDEFDMIEDTSSDESGENEQLTHLLDIVDDSSDISRSTSQEENLGATEIAVRQRMEFSSVDAADQDSSEDPSRWSWTQSVQERWLALARVMRHSSLTLSQLISKSGEYLEQARQDKVEAAAQAFKRARIVGATVIGAARRLKALRASEPFAMVVEEACEVLEPILMAVVAVPSLEKIELIGDHRQLPAFVQQCWFPLEKTHPSIKTSLFERLVGTCGDSSMCVVLDEQRRMRPGIAELTRKHYEDIVKIVDHACTRKQRLGDRLDAEVFDPTERELWDGQGRVVPGVIPQQYFWELPNGCEQRARVGLSKCNLVEAKAAAKLVQWLEESGVPRASITVITPYKGQKLTIIEELKKVRVWPEPWKTNLGQQKLSFSNAESDRVVVSTIDRYQGDENDIVILSLVSSRPGNQFVALKNRFIVAMSRARLAVYVLGSRNALKGTTRGHDASKHWCDLLRQLESPTKEIQTSRIGESLPICCPRHRSNFCLIDDVEQFPLTKNKFSALCSLPCHFRLPWCQHYCKEQCHSWKFPHTTKCLELVDRPCDLHSQVTLRCTEVHLQTSSTAKDLEEGLASYRCEVPVFVRRSECSHSVKMTCHERELGRDLGDCMVAVEDYYHPECNHIRRRPKCFQRRAWEQKTPRCTQPVTHLRTTCGCRVRMECWEEMLEVSENRKPVCLAEKTISRPRCSHKLSMRCSEAQTLLDLWKLEGGEGIEDSANIVEHGRPYGPPESTLMPKIEKCKHDVCYRASCGHIVSDLKCFEAFDCAAGNIVEMPCEVDVQIPSPICGHDIRVPCGLSKDKNATSPLTASIFTVIGSNQRVIEETVLPASQEREKKKRKSAPNYTALQEYAKYCTLETAIELRCGHDINIECARLLEMMKNQSIPPCQTMVEIKRTCGHVANVPCHERNEPLPPCSDFVYPCEIHSFVPKTCHDVSRLRSGDEPVHCPIPVESKLHRCGHLVSVPCHLQATVSRTIPGTVADPSQSPLIVKANTDYAFSPLNAPECRAQVFFIRECGHQKALPCHVAFDWAAAPEQVLPCEEPIQVLSTLCGHPLVVPCHIAALVTEWDPWAGKSPPLITQCLREDGEAVTMIDLHHDGQQPSKPPESLTGKVDCGCWAKVLHDCGHSERIPCSQVFSAFDAPECTAVEAVKCESCGVEQRLECHRLRNNQIPPCYAEVMKTCSICRVNSIKSECSKKFVECKSDVQFQLTCGHTASWECGKNSDPREQAEPCLQCIADEWAAALARSQRHAKEQYSDVDVQHLMRGFLKRIHDSLNEESFVVKKETKLDLNISRLESGQLFVLSRYTQLLQDAVEKEDAGNLLLSSPPNVMDVEHSYDIVFCQLEKLDVDTERLFLQEVTRFGDGIKATPFDANALSSLMHSRKDESVKICVGAAFKFRPKKDTPPFMKSDKERATKGDRERANRLREKCVAAGFDHLIPLTAEHRIYWTLAVVPIALFEIEFRRRCEICMELVVVGREACECDQEHVMCWSCIRDHAKHAQSIDALPRAKLDGLLRCPVPDCESTFELQEVAVQASKANDHYRDDSNKAFESLLKLKESADIKRALSPAIKAEGDRVRAEMMQGDVEKICREITEDILTLRCPKCRQAFFDFEGCFALSCSRCRVNFCAWCITHQSEYDVHTHVARCGEGNGNVFYSRAVFENHQKNRKERLVRERLSRESGAVRRLVLNKIDGELKDLEIKIDSFT